MSKKQQRKDIVFFSGKEDKQEDGVGFLVQKDIVNTVMGSLQQVHYHPPESFQHHSSASVGSNVRL